MSKSEPPEERIELVKKAFAKYLEIIKSGICPFCQASLAEHEEQRNGGVYCGSCNRRLYQGRTTHRKKTTPSE
jgi:uncharacterized Zn finger protein (UPF0148 family)